MWFTYNKKWNSISNRQVTREYSSINIIIVITIIIIIIILLSYIVYYISLLLLLINWYYYHYYWQYYVLLIIINIIAIYVDLPTQNAENFYSYVNVYQMV